MMNRRRWWGYLRIQVLMLMIVVLFIPLALVGWFYYSTMNSDLNDIERSHALEVNASAHRLVDQLGEQLSSSTITNAKWRDNWQAVKDKDVPWIEENVNVSLDIIPGLSFVATVEKDGKVLTQAGDIEEFTGEVADKSILTKLQETPDLYGMTLTSKGLAVVAASLITDEQATEEPTGVLIFGSLIDDEAMANIATLLNAGIAMKSASGQRLGSDPGTIGLLTEGNALPPVSQAPTFAMDERDGKSFSQVSSGHAGLDGASVAELAVSVPAEASSTVKSEMIQLSIIVVVLVIALIALISIILRLRIVKPLVKFDDYLKEVSEGKLSGELPNQYSRRTDEIGSIANSLVEMSSQLQKLVAGIRTTAHVTADAAGQLTGDADQAAQSADRIAESMREVAAGADSQREGMKRGADVTQEIQQQMMNIGDRSTSVAAVAEQATKQASEGNETIQMAVGQMERIAAAVEASVNDARMLHDKSAQIGQMVEAISAIAYRTNILALNANIEASRAGEQGRGFAVVAEEVRKLALQANQTTDDITQRIEDVQSGISEVVRNIEDGYREVQSGTSLVRDAGTAFQGISSGIEDMEGELREIAAAGQEIGARVEELMSIVVQTEAISESSAERSQDVAGFAEVQMSAVRRVAEAMGTLSERIRELERAANKFQ
ncbi:methyl-accepting chemotaxis protein [Cohnella panacarvi]|uniref:methyl-accepting chemotaxis protein n=1 Tax=Cohnella panacarvi TaxID=400776 RepID=UPI00047C3B65|nr:methyl-accepting chemotaxis protein [Cohnella panacarvi]